MKKTIHKEMVIRRAGYNYVCVWEYQFKNKISLEERLDRLQKKIENLNNLVLSALEEL